MKQVENPSRIYDMRQARKLQDRARYHVIARANRKEMLLDSAFNKNLFLETVKRAKSKYAFRIENFCVMGNHFHFIIQPINGANLSEIMKWILGVFAMGYNRIHHTSGHFWGDRFFSRPISSLMEYMQVFKYIDHNPVRAGQVERVEDWRFGGLWHFQRGLRDIVDALPHWLALLFPGHCQLALG